MVQWRHEPDDVTHPWWAVDAPWGRTNRRGGHSFVSPVPVGGALASLSVDENEPSLPLVRVLDVGDEIFHGTPETSGIIGLEMIFPSLSWDEIVPHVIDAGDTENLASIWLVGWGWRGAHMVSSDGLPSNACAMVIADWRYVVRIANVDARHTGADLLGLMAEAVMRQPEGWREACRHKFYVCRDVADRIAEQMSAKPWSKHAGHVEGRDVAALLGVPIRDVAELSAGEARVV